MGFLDAFASRLGGQAKDGEIQLLRRSPLLDPVWYRRSDLRDTPIDAARHYLEHGAAEGRDPHPLFSTRHYRAANPAVAAAGVNPLVHYIRTGGADRLDPGPLFDTRYYLSRYPDAAASPLDALTHYLRVGLREGRTPFAYADADRDRRLRFDAVRRYLLEQADAWESVRAREVLALAAAPPAVAPAEPGPGETDSRRAALAARAAGLFDPQHYRRQGYEGAADPLDHFLREGFRSLDPHPLFDGKLYARENHLGFDEDPLLHYLDGGWRTAPRTHALFDNAFYRETVLRDDRGIDPLTHYLTIGARTGAFPNPLFDSAWYLRRYPDVAGADGNPLVHYLLHGEREGRRPNAYFFPDWYRETYRGVMSASSPLEDYLDNAFSGTRQPNEIFNGAWYRDAHPDVRDSGAVPLRHFLLHGAEEGRDPGPAFDTRFYRRAYPDVVHFNSVPAEHYLEHGKAEGRFGRDPYPDWVAAFGTPTPADVEAMRRRIDGFRSRPTFSVVCPVYNSDIDELRRAIESVQGQIYPHWELCLSDDASPDARVAEALRAFAAADARIRLCLRSANGGIAANTNSALALANGEFVAFLDCDDELTPDALFWMAAEIDAHPDAELLFSDEDKIDVAGRRFDPYFKSDWNPALMLSQNAACHLTVVRRGLLDRVGWLRSAFDGSQDHELVLRCSRALAEAAIRHVPRILYHWRATGASTALFAGGKSYAWEAGRKAVLEHLAAIGQPAEVERSSTGHYRVVYPAPADRPLVSILMPSACKLGLVRPCLEKLFERTSWENFEIVMMVSSIRREVPEQAAFLDEIARNPRVRLNIYEDRPFNFSRLNNEAFALARGEYLVFLNDDIEVVTPDWIEQFVARMRLDRVGMVGALLHYPSGHVQHAGVTLGVGGVADHPYRFLPPDDGGCCGRALLEQDLSCVTAACAMTSASLFRELGGYDERLAVAFNDVDLCVRVRERGRRVLWTPAVRMIHHESASLGNHASEERKAQFDAEVAFIREKWGETLERDPFYNPNLSLISGRAFQLVLEPRVARAGAQEDRR